MTESSDDHRVNPTLRAERPDDRSAIAHVLLRAFGEDEGPLVVELVVALRAHPCGRDRLSFVAEVDGQVVGHAMLTRSRLDTFARTIDVAVIAPVATDPGHQGEGIGTAVVRHAIAAADAAGFPVLFLEGDPAFYRRFGFLPGKPMGFRKPSIRVPDDAFQAIRLSAYEPWMSGTLVYAEPFWDCDAVGLRNPEFLAWLADEVSAGRQL
jgi:putative acetyltransferase